MKVTFTGVVELWSLTVFAELAVWERRPELQRLCAAAPSIGDGEIDRALPGLSDAGRRNILRHLKQVKLIDDGGALTSLGRACAKSGEAPAWELGVYHFLVATHALFGHQVLDFERAGEDSKALFDGLERMPGWFTVEPERIWASAVPGGSRFSIQSLPAPRGQDPLAKATTLAPATVRWDLDPLTGDNTWRIEGSAGEKTFKSPPGSAATDRLVGVYARCERRWDERQQRVLMAYDGKASGGNDRFVRQLRHGQVDFGELGAFDEVVADGVPVGPATPAQAREWALALTLARVAEADGYCARAAWERHWTTAVNGTPLQSAAGMPPDPAAVLATSGLSARGRWLLAAPIDLGAP